jgi:hypothetical protein
MRTLIAARWLLFMLELVFVSFHQFLWDKDGDPNTILYRGSYALGITTEVLLALIVSANVGAVSYLGIALVGMMAVVCHDSLGKMISSSGKASWWMFHC